MNYKSIRAVVKDFPPRFKKQIKEKYEKQYPSSMVECGFGLIKKSVMVSREQRIWVYKEIGEFLKEELTPLQDKMLCKIVCKLEEDLGLNWEGLCK